MKTPDKQSALDRGRTGSPVKGTSTSNDLRKDHLQFTSSGDPVTVAGRTFAVAYSKRPTTVEPWAALDPMTWLQLVAWLGLDAPADRKQTGGYVLGALTGKERNQAAVVSRSALSLDADRAEAGLLDDARAVLGEDTAFAFHTTWRSTPDAPRYRLVVPLSRDVTPDEYRALAGLVNDAFGGAHGLDACGARPEQFMYRPSTQDADAYDSGAVDGGPLDVDAWLAPAPALDPYAARAIASELARLDACEAQGWNGEPWDATTFTVACNLIEFANSEWSGYGIERAEADLLEHAPTDPEFGPHEHAAKWRSALKKVGNGDRPNPHSTPADDFGPLGDPGVALTTAPDEAGGWEPLDVAAWLARPYRPLKPTLMPREDGVCLLYPGRTHSLSGESGSGKSWVAQWVAAQALADGPVLYLDYESNLDEVGTRLLALGAEEQHVGERLVYLNPDAAPSGPQFEALLPRQYVFAVVDGVTEALNTSGLRGDSLTNSNDAVTQWHAALPKRIAKETGAAVLQVDHVVKSKDNRGGYAIGGQAKRASITGAAYVVRVREALGRERSGWLELYVSKDRGGFVDGAVVGERTETGGLVANVYGHAQDDGRMEFVMRAPVVVEKAARVESMKGRVARYLNGLPHDSLGASTNAVKGEVEGKDKDVAAALDALVASGHVEVVSGPRNARLHRLARPYAPEFEDEE
ncbi:AAA family ATPase [Dermacoccus barathri]|uniref:AAA family ATPase n=1 Tax=Dermacoccus barathri TaxID=322601 RepID=A0ABN2C144_9MICO